MLESIRDNELVYKPLSKEEMERRKILGVLSGPCADVIHETRNHRKYSNTLWEKVYDSKLVKEQFACGGLFGELNHPDYPEPKLEKVAIVMPEPPKKNKEGLLVGYWHILDTPCGQILKTLCDYGYRLGISTRGNGEVITDYDGNESVDPDTYELNALDIVPIPAVEKARLDVVKDPVVEGVKRGRKKKTLTTSLKEALARAESDDRAIMEETLTELGLTEALDEVKVNTNSGDIEIKQEDDKTIIELTPAEDPAEEIPMEPTEDVDIDDKVEEETEVEEENKEAEDFGSMEVIEDLQKSLRRNKELEHMVESLQRQLSVSNAMEEQLKKEVANYKEATVRLSSRASKVRELKEKVLQLESKCHTQSLKANKLVEKVEEGESLRQKAISESYELRDRVNKMSSEQKSLREEKEKLNQIISQYQSKLSKAKDLVEHYKKASQIASDKCIELMSASYGVNKSEVLSRLNESYTLKDVDKVCEDLRSYSLRINKLPFDVTNKRVRVAVTESKVNKLAHNSIYDDDDVVDDQLTSMLNNRINR